jgi:glycosyltransferase involved in cell wall biosynthesis
VPNISAVIPCYNAGPFLAQAIESVLSQTRAVDEVLLVDDGSTDNSASIAQRYPIRYSRIEVNSGNAVARNICLREARGDLVAWLDADDYWEPHHVATIAALLDRYPEAGAAFGAVRLVGAAEGVARPRIPPGPPVDFFWDSFWRTPGPQNAAIGRRDAMLAIGGYDERIRSGNDFDMWMRFARYNKLVSSHDITANYRWHSAQLSTRPEQQYRNTYLARTLFRDQVAAEGDSALAEAMERKMRWIWEEDLERAWSRREMRAVRYLLRFADLVPQAPQEVRSRFARRAWMPRLALRAWDLGPTGLGRKVIEQFLGRTSPHGGP